MVSALELDFHARPMGTVAANVVRMGLVASKLPRLLLQRRVVYLDTNLVLRVTSAAIRILAVLMMVRVRNACRDQAYQVQVRSCMA